MFALPGIEYFAFFMFAAPGLACAPMRNRNHAVGGNVAAPSYHKHIACSQKGGVDRAFFIAEQDIVLDRLLGKGGGLEDIDVEHAFDQAVQPSTQPWPGPLDDEETIENLWQKRTDR